MVSAWPSTPQVPFAFGGVVRCGTGGDSVSGPVTLALYGAGTIYMRFFIPSARPSIQVAVVANLRGTGTPIGPLVLTLYSDSNGSRGSVITSTTIPVSSVSPTVPTWTPFATLTSSFNAGYYWLTVNSPSSISSAYYQGYLNLGQNWNDLGAYGNYIPPPGFFGNSGASVIWVQDSSGNDLSIDPFGVGAIIGPTMADWIADSNYQMNVVAPWLSDMDFEFKPYTASFTLTDMTTGLVQGSAPASQYYNSHGLMGVIPFQLNSVVNIIQGHRYRTTVNDTSGVYNTLFRGSTIDPVKAAPGGISPYQFGELMLADFSQYRVLDYGGTTILKQSGHGGIGGADLVATRFVPTQNGTLQSTALKMNDKTGSLGNYPAGIPVTCSVYASNEATLKPVGSALASVTVDSGTIPRVGYLNTPNFSFALTSGTPYWLVWSAATAPTSTYVPQRNVSPYRFMIQTSTDAGNTWFRPGQGPSEVGFKAITSSEILGSPFDDVMGITVDKTTNYVAQPFILSKDSTVSCIFTGMSGGTCAAAIYPDSGTGPNMSGSPLGQGTFNTSFQYFYSQIVIPFGTNVAPVKANVKYWAVLYSMTTSNVVIPYYWIRPSDPSIPVGYDALKSRDGGVTWTTTVPSGSAAATTIFMAGVQPSGTMTQIPTTVSVSAKVH